MKVTGMYDEPEIYKDEMMREAALAGGQFGTKVWHKEGRAKTKVEEKTRPTKTRIRGEREGRREESMRGQPDMCVRAD